MKRTFRLEVVRPIKEMTYVTVYGEMSDERAAQMVAADAQEFLEEDMFVYLNVDDPDEHASNEEVYRVPLCEEYPALVTVFMEGSESKSTKLITDIQQWSKDAGNNEDV